MQFDQELELKFKVLSFSISRNEISLFYQHFQNFITQMQENVTQEPKVLEEGRILLRYENHEVEGECVILQISPVKRIMWRFILFCISNVLLMLPWLITFWYPRFQRIFYYAFCSLEQADGFYIVNYDEQVSIVEKTTKTFMINEKQSRLYTMFVNRYMTYIIDENLVVRVSLYQFRDSISKIMSSQQRHSGLSACQAYQMNYTYGPGAMQIEKPTCVTILVKEILRPLYLFLLFSVSYWTFYQRYYYFAGTLFFISAIGLVINLIQTLSLNDKIFSMAYYEVNVNVLRQGRIESISSIDVVPGDIVFLKEAIKIPFEAIVLQGSALINECALTGQSVPVVKKADPIQKMCKSSNAIDKNAYVYEGTTIIQVNDKKKMSKFQEYREKFGIPVFVIRTNFVTTKGQLIRIILFPKEQQNIFQKESTKYLVFLFLLAVATYIILVILIHSYVQVVDLVTKFVDLITITVPPSLPVSMTFGIIYAIERLQQKNIFCIAQNKVISGGMIEFCCFDKTGTLTEDFMDFECIVPANETKFYPAISNKEENIEKMFNDLPKSPFFKHILVNMASVNSIIKIQATNELIGDPMEVKAFQFGRFELNQSSSDPDVIFGFESKRGQSGLIFRRFQFDSDLQRMSVAVKNMSQNTCGVYAKGSPEMMLTIMKQSSVPKNYNNILKNYASRGFRVLAIASKPINESVVKSITRQQAQTGLSFDGFEVFENKLKPQTKGAIAQLKQAAIGCVMITGDNTLTGSNISYKCNIANVNKAMIICDFQQGGFNEQNFNYDNEQTQQPNKTEAPAIHPTLDERQFKNSYEIQLKTKDMVSSEKFNADQGTSFMTYISEKAQATNSQLCITGRAFNQLFPGMITELDQLQCRFMNHAAVFARTKPNDKAKIVMAFQHMDRKVSMCGDGANDCGALKQADIGLSLSQAEASISAPFTSRVPNISSMVELIKECRAGLATNFSLFNIMAIYSLTQYSTTVLSEKFIQYNGDLQYLYWDLVLNFCFIVFIGYTGSADKLSVDRPRSSLFSFTNLFSMMVVFVTVVVSQIVFIAVYEKHDPTYYWTNGGMDNAISNYNNGSSFELGLESTILYVFINNSYVISILAFSIAAPWRKYFFTNIPFMIVTVLALAYNQIIILWGSGTWSALQVGYLPTMSVRWLTFGVSWAFCIFILLIQKLVLEPLGNYLVKKYPQVKWL